MPFSFRLASYNILANSYIKPQWYPDVDPGMLDWGWRGPALTEKIERLDADIVCLQEVEQVVFDALFDRLSAKSYAGVFARKRQGKPDGCAVFFRPCGLQFVESESFYFHDGLAGAPDSGHLALIATFESEAGVIKVAGTHLKWGQEDKPLEEHLGHRQAKEMIAQRIKTDHTSYAWVICGDFNAQPNHPILRHFADAGFVDAYRGHEQDTCNSNHRAKRIDFILHTSGLNASPVKLIEIDDLTPLPSIMEPSDHLALTATLSAQGK
jgi:mRNA deadenylase 3'-5' endonuclease subunit Ccr4